MQVRIDSGKTLNNNDLEAFVKRALTKAVRDTCDKGLPRQSPHPIPQLVETLSSKSMVTSRDVLADALFRLSRCCVPVDVIIDQYLPAIAKKLGEGWKNDELSFADVSIGSSRVQTMLKQLEVRQTLPGAQIGASSILVINPLNAQHTLGPSILANQLRREGLNVELELNVSNRDIKKLMACSTYDAVFISAGRTDDLDSVAQLIETARTFDNSIPYLTGGEALAFNPEMKLATGADLATCDLTTAVCFSGIKPTINSQAQTELNYDSAARIRRHA